MPGTQKANNSESFGAACQYCWRRKIKCQEEDGTGCKACQSAGIKCVARVRGPLGRPKGSRKHSWRIASKSETQQITSTSTRTSNSSNDLTHSASSSINIPSCSPLLDDRNVPMDFSVEHPSTFSLDESVTTNSGDSVLFPEMLMSNLGGKEHHLFPRIVQSYLQLLRSCQNPSIDGEEEHALVMQTLEELCELVAETCNRDCTTISWNLGDSSLLFLFITVLSAVEACRRLALHRGQTTINKATYCIDISPTNGNPTTHWWNDGFDPILAALTTQSPDMPDMLSTFINDSDMENASQLQASGQPLSALPLPTTTPLPTKTKTCSSRNRALLLTQLDIVLFDLNHFARKFSQLLLCTEAQDDTVTQPLLDRLTAQTEQSLTAIHNLHIQINDDLVDLRLATLDDSILSFGS